VPHSDVLRFAADALGNAGYAIQKTDLGLSQDNMRFFGTLTLGTQLHDGAALAVGIRSSLDKSISMEWCCGSRVFCCDNLAFFSEVSISRRHTTHGIDRYQEAICRAVSGLDSFREMESRRIERMVSTSLTDERAESLLLRAFDQRILSNRTLPVAYREWRAPSFDEFSHEKNLYRLWNAVTYALGPRAESNPQSFTAATICLGRLLSPEDAPRVLAG
jgi:hypothetical protein